jgi:uncharacterized DUF497 family protein
MLDIDALLGGMEGVEWDAGNTAKNVFGHDVSQSEAEEIFFHAPVVLLEDAKHSATERRFVIYGPTNGGRLLTAAFTIRAKLKPMPHFRSHEEAGEFWMTHDTAEYLDWSRARRVSFPNLRPSTATISLRLPQGLLDELRTLANQRDVPYQSLLKVYLAERIAQERRAVRPRRRSRASA